MSWWGLRRRSPDQDWSREEERETYEAESGRVKEYEPRKVDGWHCEKMEMLRWRGRWFLWGMPDFKLLEWIWMRARIFYRRYKKVKCPVPSYANPCLSRVSTPPSVSSDHDLPDSISTHDETIIDQQLQDIKDKPQLFWGTYPQYLRAMAKRVCQSIQNIPRVRWPFPRYPFVCMGKFKVRTQKYLLLVNRKYLKLN